MKIINSIQEKILQRFGEIKDSDQFYLSGGTALVYFYLMHRQSNDLDFFTQSKRSWIHSHQLKRIWRPRDLNVRQGVSFFIELSRGGKPLIHLALIQHFVSDPPRIFRYPA